jgi:two-component sensor histidine kinase
LATDKSRFITEFNGRLQALARTHDVLAEWNSTGAPLAKLLAALVVDDLPRYALAGPDVTLPPQTALHLALLLHELAANALRHGALSAECGTVAVTWTLSEEPRHRLVLRWRETGGPPVTQPLKRGFGRTVIDRVGNLPHLQARPRFAPEGFACDIEADIASAEAMPRPYFDPAKSGAASQPPATPTRWAIPVGGTATAGRGRCRVLFIEDEPLIAMEIETILREAGFQICGPVASVSEALAMLQASACDIATVDGSLLHGEPADAVVDALQEHAIPFAFVTGLTPEAVPPAPHLADVPLIGKPIDPVTLVAALDRLATSRRAGN